MNPRFSNIIDVSSTPTRVSSLSQVYGLLCLAMLLTALGCYFGLTIGLPLIASGWIVLLLIVELAIIWTSPFWSKSTPLNYILFAAFPLISGLTLAPIIISVLVGYINGVAILTNALVATTLLTASAAVLATMIKSDLFGMFGQFLFLSIIGLLIVGILQLFVPSLRTGGAEIVISALGVIIFSLFLAVDMQRVARRAYGASPFVMALSLYLDIYNMFLFVLRFILATGGRRR